MKRSMVVWVLTAVMLAGCGMSGDYTSPGNRKSIAIDRVVTTVSQDAAGKPVTTVNRTSGRYVANGQSSDVGTLKYDGVSGNLLVSAVKIEDKVAGEQAATARQVSADTRETILGTVQTLATLVPLLGGGAGGVSLPGVAGGGTTQASPTLALAREAALGRIAACPFLGQAEKDRLASLVPLAPESVLVKILASLPTSPTTKPEVNP